jgi:hypothetical protein
MTDTFTAGQHAAIYDAREDYRYARLAGRRVDVVDIATETCNYWWTRLDDRRTRIAGRFITFGIAPLDDDVREQVTT